MVKHNGDLPPVWIARWDRLQHNAELLIDDENVPAVIRGVCGLVLELVDIKID